MQDGIRHHGQIPRGGLITVLVHAPEFHPVHLQDAGQLLQDRGQVVPQDARADAPAPWGEESPDGGLRRLLPEALLLIYDSVLYRTGHPSSR